MNQATSRYTIVMNTESPGTTDTPQPATKPRPSILLRIGLAIVFVSACALAGIDYQAKSKWQKAVDSANKLFDADEDNPATFMKSIGITPHVKTSNGELTQVYRWKGGLRTFDLELVFKGSDGAYVFDKLNPITPFRLSAGDLTGWQLAKTTGTLSDKLPEPEEPEEGGGMAMMGGGGGGAPGALGGGGRGGGGRRGISAEQLELEGDNKAKYEEATSKMREKIGELFQGGGSREERSEKFAQLRKEFETELKTVLNKDQFKKYQELRNQQRQGRGGRGGGGGRGGPGGGGAGNFGGPPGINDGESRPTAPKEKGGANKKGEAKKK